MLNRITNLRKSIEILGYNCEICNSNKYINLHHKDGNSTNNPLDGSNWQRLCASCHRTLHWKPRKKFKNYKEGILFYTKLQKARKKRIWQNAIYKEFKTYNFLRTKDICKKMGLTRERIRQLRNEGFLNFIKVNKETFLYPPNYRKSYL